MKVKGPFTLYDARRSENEPFSRYQVRAADGTVLAHSSQVGDFGVYALDSEDKKAVANLLVASHEMLTALQIAEEAFENFAGAGKDDGTLGVIRSAIAKAKGLA